MPRYLHHVTLDTGHSRRSYRDEVADAAIAAVHDGLSRALSFAGTHVTVPAQDSGWTYTATASGRCLLVTMWAEIAGEKAPVATFGVASHSRSGAQLWRLLHAPRTLLPPYATSPDRAPAEPWVAARLELGAGLVDPHELAWIADFERVIGWAWLSRGKTMGLALG